MDYRDSSPEFDEGRLESPAGGKTVDKKVEIKGCADEIKTGNKVASEGPGVDFEAESPRNVEVRTFDIKADSGNTSATMGVTTVEIEADLAGRLVGSLTGVWRSKQIIGLEGHTTHTYISADLLTLLIH